MKTNKKIKIEDLKVQSFVTSINKNAANTVNGGQEVTKYKGCISYYGGCIPTDTCGTLGHACTLGGNDCFK